MRSSYANSRYIQNCSPRSGTRSAKNSPLRKRTDTMLEKIIVHVGRWGLLLLMLAAWQWAWDFHRTFPVPKLLDPYFISKPSLIWQRFLELGCFADPQTGVWPSSDAFIECL